MKEKMKLIAPFLALIILYLAMIIFINNNESTKFKTKYDLMMENPMIINKTREMSKAELIYDLSIIAEREGIIISPPENDLYIRYYNESTESWQSEIPEGETANVKSELSYNFYVRFRDIYARHGTALEEPTEVRFIIQAMLFIRDRNLSDDLENLVRIAGYYDDDREMYNFGIYTEMTVKEFEELYNECNVDTLPHEEQIKVLTNAWINKTGYDRKGIDQKYRVTPPDMSKYLK